jgi:hypothetical protein
MGNTGSDAHTMTGSFSIYGIGNTSSTLTIIGSGSTNPLFTVQGSQGQLFSVTDILSGSLQKSYWNNIEKDYSYAILSQKNQVDNSFYNELQTGKQSRLFTRYLENYVKGNSVDLYPTNKIYFSYDSANSYVESSGWAKSPNSFGTASNFDPKITRRYFLGAYSNGQDVTGVANFGPSS